MGDAPKEVPLGDAPKEVTLGGAPKEVTLGERPQAAIREQLYDNGCIHPIVMAYIAPDSAMLHPGYRYFLTLPRFHVHQIAGKLKMNGGRDEQEGIGSKPAVYG